MRLVSVDSWTVIVWRGALLGLTMLVVLVTTRRKLRIRSLGVLAFVAIVALAGTSLFFISAVNQTTVANVLVIASSAPLFAAVLGWLFLRQRPTRATSVAVVMVFVGLAIIFSGSLATSFIVGDLLALGYALSLAGYFVALQRCSEDQMLWIVVLGGMLSGAVAWPFTSATTGLGVGNGGDVCFLLLFGGVIAPASTVLLSFGPKYMPAAHVTLIMMLEIVLGPLWV